MANRGHHSKCVCNEQHHFKIHEAKIKARFDRTKKKDKSIVIVGGSNISLSVIHKTSSNQSMKQNYSVIFSIGKDFAQPLSKFDTVDMY